MQTLRQVNSHKYLENDVYCEIMKACGHDARAIVYNSVSTGMWNIMEPVRSPLYLTLLINDTQRIIT